MVKLNAEIKLTRVQHHFLCARYGRRKDASARTLIDLAIKELVADQAREELAEAEAELQKEIVNEHA